MENKIIEISKILGVTPENLADMPSEILDSMYSILENVEVRNDEDRKMLYDELDKYWVKGQVLSGMKELSESTGITYETFCNLDSETQQNILFEYMADGDFNRIYELLNKALAVMELEKVSSLIDVPIDKLKKLPRDTQEKICGHYAMEYEENGDNSALASVLKGLVNDV